MSRRMTWLFHINWGSLHYAASIASHPKDPCLQKKCHTKLSQILLKSIKMAELLGIISADFRIFFLILAENAAISC